METQSQLTLSNGEVFQGRDIGSPTVTSGELVFTTAMVGYTEALTDPSYYGQVLVFSFPLIGNYGVPELPKAGNPPLGFESKRVQVAGVVVVEESAQAFHRSSVQNLSNWLRENQIPGIAGLDTRFLIQKIRQSKNLLARIEPHACTDAKSDSQFFDPGLSEVVPFVSTAKRERVGKGSIRIGLIDCGVKWNIIRQLVSMGCEVEILPWNTDFRSVDCQGWVLSNGPGDPERTGDLRTRVQGLLKGQRPILGICLGHQILALAGGAQTQRLPYGHRSHNQPVYDLKTRRGVMTTQNHGFVVEETSLPSDWEVWFKNANDGSIEGIRHLHKPFRGVQFHPESAGGPQDTSWILREFVQEVSKS